MGYGLTRTDLPLAVFAVLSLALGLWLAYRRRASRTWGDGYSDY